MRRLLPLLAIPLLWAMPVVSYHLDTWEDGSGVLYVTADSPANWVEVQTFPADTFGVAR